MRNESVVIITMIWTKLEAEFQITFGIDIHFPVGYIKTSTKSETYHLLFSFSINKSRGKERLT